MIALKKDMCFITSAAQDTTKGKKRNVTRHPKLQFNHGLLDKVQSSELAFDPEPRCGARGCNRSSILQIFFIVSIFSASFSLFLQFGNCKLPRVTWLGWAAVETE